MSKRTEIKNAEADFRIKKRFERKLSRKMVNQFNLIARDTKKHYINTKNILILDVFMPDVMKIIEDHYLSVAKVFSKRVDRDDIKLTEIENDLLKRSIELEAKQNANYSSKEILNTAQKDINNSFSKARIDALNNGNRLSSRKLASIVSVLFKQKSISRAKTTIPVTQTQQAAEKTKFKVFNAHHNSIKKTNQKNATKTWHTVGDEKVREIHRSANLQEQQINIPYEVGGEKLMQPGDTSLGATAGNTINCRCSSQYSFN